MEESAGVMSLRSMTGYGRGVAVGEGVTVTVELSSVNRKQLDIALSLPRGLNLLEARISEEVHGTITRGRVTVDLSIDWSGEARRKAVRMDTELAAAYVRVLRNAAEELGVSSDLDIQTLAALPDVMHYARPQEDIERVWRVMKKALVKALKDLNDMRGREGRSLQKDLQERLRSLGTQVEAIRKRAPQVVARYRRTLIQRLKEADLELERNDERLMKEIALFADRSDISEELTRLESHLKQARRMTRSKEATGRSLDFLAQEMFREINTVGSKANDTAILQRVVDFKAELERIREQVQNVE